MVKWEDERVKTHGIWGEEKQGYHEFGRWEMVIIK